MPEQSAAGVDDARDALAAMLARGARRASACGDEIAELWEVASRTLVGGKLVRPRLLVEVVAALSGAPGAEPSPGAAVARAGAALEILHAAFLLHDDVIDGDLTRRGRDNLIGVLSTRAREGSVAPGRALHFARSAAILAGDLLLTCAHLELARLDIEPGRRLALLDLLDDATLETVSGENLDVALADGVRLPDLPTVLDMTSRKTAAYTVELPLRMAAVLAGRPDLDDVMRRAGRHLGLVYQLQDDLLSAFGDPADHGKDPLSDLREGKQTVLVALARDTDAWGEIAPDLGRADLTAAEGDAVRGRLEACGARAGVERLIAAEFASARRTLLEAPAVPAAAAAALGHLMDGLDRRVA